MRGRLDQSPLDAMMGCANCGRATADVVIGESLSVVARDGGRRLAPPIPLCERCRRDVIYKRGWLPTWCAPCQRWQAFGHDHGNLVTHIAHDGRTQPTDREPLLQAV
jgi:hypothetical protein